jgi:hypothetical protein
MVSQPVAHVAEEIEPNIWYTIIVAVLVQVWILLLRRESLS